MIQISELSLMRGTKELLIDANAVVYPGHKVGLIGANGCGKSSLFAMLRGFIQPDKGECGLPKQWDIVAVAQETPASDSSALDYVIDGDMKFRQLEKALAEAEAAHEGEKIAHLHAEIEVAGGYDIRARAATILAGLGFSQEQLSTSVKGFSGGWRMRLNLAQALLCRSDLLLLDEPTNHLDLDAVIWLEKWLQRYAGTLLLISHDKSFLDSTINQIVSVEQQQLITYTGNYSSYEIQRAERHRLQNIEAKKQADKVAHLESFINRFKAKASKAKQAQSRVKQLEKMQTLLPAQVHSPFSFAFFEPPTLPNPLVMMEEVKIGYGETVILNEVKLNLVPGSRIGLLGKNGAGKSTLIKLLAGEKSPMQGNYTTSAGLRIGYFAQHQLEYLDASDTPLGHIQRLDKQAKEQTLRDYLGGFGFHGDAALSQVAPMSGGEKARLVLALLVYQKPNLLLLDEPTNHLDLDMRNAINLALQSFAGALVVVSHDRYLLTSVCDDFYLVDSGKVDVFSGDLDDYKQWILSDDSKVSTDKTDKDTPKIDKKQQKRLEAEFRQSTSQIRKGIKQQEQQMDKLNKSIADIQSQLADADIYLAENKAKLTQLMFEEGKAKESLEETEMAWLDNQDELESAQAEFNKQING